MIDFIRQHWTAIAALVTAVVGAGFIIKLMWTRSGRDATIVNQKGASARGDVVGRDKITRR